MEDHEVEARIHGWMTLTKILVPTCLYCTKFGQLTLREIIKIVATRCPIVRLKCTKLQHSRRPHSWISRAYFLRIGRGEEEKGMGEEGTGGKGREWGKREGDVWFFP